MKKYKVTVNGTAYEIELEEITGDAASAAAPAASAASAAAPAEQSNDTAVSGEKVTAPMPGNILDVKVKVGDTVQKGDVLIILEAMKMENEIMAGASGKVVSIGVNKGESVETGKVLLVIG